MRERFPLDLTGQISIPDTWNAVHGGLADVYLGVMGDKKVAVKRLRIRKINKNEDWEESNERRLRREMHVWAALKHPNISEFLGYMTSPDEYPAMISIWYQRGTVPEYLDSEKLPVSERLELVRKKKKSLHILRIIGTRDLQRCPISSQPEDNTWRLETK